MNTLRDETRTKLSSRATPFRPSIGELSTSSSLVDSQSVAAFASSSYPNITDLDSTAGSVGDMSTTPGSILAPSTPPGTFLPSPSSFSAQLPMTWSGPFSQAWSPSSGFAPDPQGAADSSAGSSQFKVGDFRSKLFQRAQVHASSKVLQAQYKSTQYKPEVHFTKHEAWSGEVKFMQALMQDGFPTPGRNANGKGQSSEPRIGDRRQAMNKSMQPSSPRAQTPDPWERQIMSDNMPTTLQHAATFKAAFQALERATPQSARESADPFKEALPVRRTFIHFPEALTSITSSNDGPIGAAFHASAPAIMTSKDFSTKYPLMESAHMRGDCRPCVYFTKKADGCRWGDGCEFCHLCPVGSLQRKRREKVKQLREQEIHDFYALSRRHVNQLPDECSI